MQPLEAIRVRYDRTGTTIAFFCAPEFLDHYRRALDGAPPHLAEHFRTATLEELDGDQVAGADEALFVQWLERPWTGAVPAL